MRWPFTIVAGVVVLGIGFGAGRLTAPGTGKLRSSEEAATHALLSPPMLAFPNGNMAGKIAFGPNYRGAPAFVLPVAGKAAVVATFSEGGAHEDPGLVRVVYLRPGHRGWMPAPEQAASVAAGFSGKAGTVTVRNELGPSPMVQVESGSVGQACTGRELALIELAPDRPRVLVQGLPAARSHIPGEKGDYTGRISQRGGHLWIDYTGGQARSVELRRQGDRLQPASPLPAKC